MTKFDAILEDDGFRRSSHAPSRLPLTHPIIIRPARKEEPIGAGAGRRMMGRRVMALLAVLLAPFAAVGSEETPQAASAEAPAQRGLSPGEIARRLELDRRVLVSTWPAGFPDTLAWSADHVVDDGEGGVALRLTRAPEDHPRRYIGGEIQSRGYRPVWGRTEWRARLPRGLSGSAAAMFLYKSPHKVETEREFDFEYVPGSPSTSHPFGVMQMTLHMKRHDGQGEKEYRSYRIETPPRCVEAICGWAIEFQPTHVLFQLDLQDDGGWETIARFDHGDGWDQAAGSAYNGKPTRPRNDFSSDEIWSEQPVNAFASYWATDNRRSWLGDLDEEGLADHAPPFVIKSMKLENYDRLSPFEEGDWSVAPGGEITIRSTPDDALELTGIEYRIDGGPWSTLGAKAPGIHAPIQTPRPGDMVEIRGVARGPAFAFSGHEVASPPSAPKRMPTR